MPLTYFFMSIQQDGYQIGVGKVTFPTGQIVFIETIVFYGSQTHRAATTAVGFS